MWGRENPNSKEIRSGFCGFEEHVFLLQSVDCSGDGLVRSPAMVRNFTNCDVVECTGADFSVR